MDHEGPQPVGKTLCILKLTTGRRSRRTGVEIRRVEIFDHWMLNLIRWRRPGSPSNGRVLSLCPVSGSAVGGCLEDEKILRTTHLAFDSEVGP